MGMSLGPCFTTTNHVIISEKLLIFIFGTLLWVLQSLMLCIIYEYKAALYLKGNFLIWKFIVSCYQLFQAAKRQIIAFFIEIQ